MNSKVELEKFSDRVRWIVFLIGLTFFLTAAVGVSAETSSPIAADLYVELGWLPQGKFAEFVTSRECEIYDVANTFYVEFGTTLWLYDVLFAGGSVLTQMHNDKLGFDPTFVAYTFQTGVQFWHIKVYWMHICQHSVVMNSWMSRVTYIRGEGSFDQIAIRFQLEH